MTAFAESSLSSSGMGERGVAGGSGELIERRALVEHLAGGAVTGIPVVLVQAPAGYGKTVALRQWAGRDPRPFVWVRLRDAAADPGRLLASVRSALRRDGRVAPLDDGWDRQGHAFVVVLDGLRRPAGSRHHAVVGTLARALPPDCQLVVGSREQLDPVRDLGLGGLRGRHLRIDQRHLAFSVEETRQAVAALGLDLPPAALRGLVDSTEGWPVGVYLAGLSMNGHTDVAAVTAGFRGDDVRVLAYLRDEVLVQQPEELRDFLLRSSVLERLSGPLCDAVLGTTGSAARLADVMARNLFVQPHPAPHEAGWLRYHPLFAQMLRSQLRDRHPDAVAGLHARASVWVADHELPEAAIDHALAGGDVVAAAHLVSRHGRRLMDAGRLDEVRTWVEALGDDAPERYPPLGVTAAWAAGLSGDVPGALRNLLAAERGSFQGPMPDGSSSLASAVAMAHATMAPRGVERMVVDARRAVELEPSGALWGSTAVMLLGSALLMTGDTDGAADAYRCAARGDRVEEAGVAQDSQAQLSLLAVGRGDWPAAAAAATEAGRLMRAAGREGFMPSLVTFAAEARVALHEDDREAAAADVATALRLYREQSPLAFPWFAAYAAVVLGELLLDLEDAGQGRELAAEAHRHLIRLLTEGVLRSRLDALDARLDGVERRAFASRGAGVPAAAAAPAAPAAPAARPAGLSEAEVRVLAMLATHLSLREIGEELYLSRNTVKSHVTAIHRKLGCATRAQAVTCGRALGLIDG
jgi:LuxR family maltose regulon positive regulatory protein